ncbi:MFS transporter [Enterococcus sp. LJL90]
MAKLLSVGGLMIALTYALARMSAGLFMPSIAQSLALTDLEIGLIGSSGYLSYAFSLLAAVPLIDFFASKKATLLAGFFATSGLLAIGLSSSFKTLLVAVFVAGLGGGIASAAWTQIVKETLLQKNQNQMNTWINSGASLGFVLITPLVLFFRNQWRLSYFMMAFFGSLILISNFLVIPNVSKPKKFQLNFTRFIKQDALVLLSASFLFGFVSAIYWTFSRVYVAETNLLGETESLIFWLVMAISGFLGGFSGKIANEFGLKKSFHLSFLLMSLAISMLSLANSLLLFTSAVLFGGIYVLLTGFFIVWGTKIFSKNPDVGVSFSFFALGIGQAVGVFCSGIFIEAFSYDWAFYFYAIIGCFSLLIKVPKEAR